MQLSEHEMTAAVRGAARTVLAVRGRRKKDADPWERLSRMEQYTMLSSLGEQILPVLAALPGVDVPPGGRPTFTAQQVEAAVAERVEPSLGRLKRAVVVKARTALVRSALDSIPPRLDPDALPPLGD